MKTNEAPEKIYIQSFNVSEEDAKFDKSKMFFDDVWTEEPEPEQENIEYSRTDTFMKKVINFLEMLGYGFTITDNITHTSYDKEQLIEDFKNYMKGE